MALGSDVQYKASVLFQAAYDKESAKNFENRLVDLSKNAAEMSKKEFAKAFKGLGNIINEALRTLKMPEIDVSNILKTNTNIEAFSKLGEEFGESFNAGIELALTNNGNINKLLEIKRRELEKSSLYKATQRAHAIKHLTKDGEAYNIRSGNIRGRDFSNTETENIAAEMDDIYKNIENLAVALKSINSKTHPDEFRAKFNSLQDEITKYIEGVVGLQDIPSLSTNPKYTVKSLRQLTAKYGFDEEYWETVFKSYQKNLKEKQGTEAYTRMLELEDAISKLEAQAKYASKSIRDITQAVGEMSSLSRPEQKKKVKGVEQVISDVESGKAGQVGRAFNQYKDAKDAGSDWVTMYSKALKFLTAFNAMNPEKQLTAERDWRILAERLNPMFDQIKSSLELFVQTANARLYPPSGGGDGTGGGTGGGSGSGIGAGGSGSGGVGAGTQPEQSNNAPKIEEENNALKEKLNLLKQIAAAYEYQADAELDDNDQEWDNARESVEEFENAYYSAIVTMQDGSKVELLLDDEFAETAQNILADAKNIQNIDLVPKSAEAAIQAYNHVEQVQANIRSSLSRSWSQPINGKTEDALLYLGRTRTMLETAISNMNQGDPDGSWDFSGAQQTATQLLSTIEDMQQKFAMMLQTEHKLKEMNITPDAEHYYDVVEGIKNNTLTTVDQCIAKYKELAGIVDVVDDKTDTTPETGRGAGDESGSGGFGSGSGDGGGGGPNDGELKNLEAIESVVGRIKTAVGEKSKAFLEEQVIVKRVAQSEVHSLGEVEKKVNAVRVALERICGGKISSGMMTINIKTSGNGSGKKPGTAKSGMDDEIFDAKIATQFSKLFLMTEQLRASGKLTDTVRDKLDLLWDDLNNVSDAKSLTLWREEFAQINNEIKEIALANKSVEDVDVDPFSAALENAKLYNKFVLKMHGTNDAELKNKYETMANDLLVEQSQLLNGIVLTKEQEKQLDDLKNQRELDILELQKKQELQAKKAADAKAKNEIIEANKKLGQLQAQQEQAPKEIQGSFDYLINQQKQIIEDKSKLLSIDKELYDADRVKAYNEAIGRLKIEEAKANHREDISESNRTFRRQVANSRTNAQLSRSRSTVFAGQEIISNLDKIKNAVGVTEASKAKINELRGALDDLKQTYNTLNNQAEPISKEDADKVISQTNNVRLLNAEMKKLLEQHQKLSGDNVDVIGVYSPKMTRKDIEDQTLEWYKKMHQQNPDEYKGINIKGFDDNGNLIASLKSGAKEFTNISVAVDKLSGNIAVVRGQVKKTLGPVDLIIDKTKQLGYYLTGSFLINFARQQVQKGIQYVREIDSALTDLKKVTDETEETYEKFLDTASKTADKVGSTIKEIVSSTADWSRLGYSLEDAAKLAETTSVLLNVSEFSSIDEATSALTSTLQAFGYTADNAMGVVDVMNEVGKYIARR